MPLAYFSPATRATLGRTLKLWLLSNLGGTAFLTLYFAHGRLDDYSIALMTGVIAAIVSLGIVPLVIPFFAVMTRLCSGWLRCYMALTGVVLFFLLANEVLLWLLPLGSVLDLLGLSSPYLVAALASVLWLYSPAQRRPTRVASHA